MTTARDWFVGANVTEMVSDGLKIEAKEKGISVSHLLSHILSEWLIKRGHIEKDDPECCKK